MATRLAVIEKLIGRDGIALLRCYCNKIDARPRDEQFLAYGLKTIAKFADNHNNSHCAIDVGAGFQCEKSVLNLSDKYPTIALAATYSPYLFANYPL